MPPKHRSQVQVELYESDKKPVGAEMQGKIVPPRNDDAFRRIYVIQIGSNSGFTARGMPHEVAACLFPNLPLSLSERALHNLCALSEQKRNPESRAKNAR